MASSNSKARAGLLDLRVLDNIKRGFEALYELPWAEIVALPHEDYRFQTCAYVVMNQFGDGGQGANLLGLSRSEVAHALMSWVKAGRHGSILQIQQELTDAMARAGLKPEVFVDPSQEAPLFLSDSLVWTLKDRRKRLGLALRDVAAVSATFKQGEMVTDGLLQEIEARRVKQVSRARLEFIAGALGLQLDHTGEGVYFVSGECKPKAVPLGFDRGVRARKFGSNDLPAAKKRTA